MKKIKKKSKLIIICSIACFSFSTVSAQSTTQKIGNTYYHSDGSTTQKIGNTYYNSNGRTTQKIGNTYYHSDPY